MCEYFGFPKIFEDLLLDIDSEVQNKYYCKLLNQLLNAEQHSRHTLPIRQLSHLNKLEYLQKFPDLDDNVYFASRKKKV